MKQLPDYSTLQKSARRIGNARLDKLLLKFADTCSNIQIGIDSTGFELRQASSHYLKKLRLQTKEEKKTRMRGRPEKIKVKKFQHTTFVSDMIRQLILAVDSSRGPKSDCKTLIPAFNKIESIFPKIKTVYADRGYDSEYNFEYVIETIKAKPFIKIKNKDIPINRTRGEYRKKAKRKLLNPIGRPRKNYRNITETIFSVVKRKIGSYVSAITPFMQRNEILYKAIAYNILRLIA